MLPVSAIWEEALVIIRREMTEASYRNLIIGLVADRIEDGNVFVLVMPKNSPLNIEVKYSSLYNVYMEKITAALSAVTGTHLTVRLELSDASLKNVLP